MTNVLLLLTGYEKHSITFQSSSLLHHFRIWTFEVSLAGPCAKSESANYLTFNRWGAKNCWASGHLFKSDVAVKDEHWRSCPSIQPIQPSTQFPRLLLQPITACYWELVRVEFYSDKRQQFGASAGLSNAAALQPSTERMKDRRRNP